MTTSYDGMDRPTLQTVPDFSVDPNADLAKGELTKVDPATGYNQRELAGTFRTASRLWFGKYQLGGFLSEDNLFEVTHRSFKPETWIGG